MTVIQILGLLECGRQATYKSTGYGESIYRVSCGEFQFKPSGGQTAWSRSTWTVNSFLSLSAHQWTLVPVGEEQ